MDISVEEFEKLDKSQCVIIDIRDNYAFTYGHIDGSVNVPQNEFNMECPYLDRDKKIIMCFSQVSCTNYYHEY